MALCLALPTLDYEVPSSSLATDGILCLTVWCFIAQSLLLTPFHIGLNKSGYQVNIFSYFSTKTYIVGTH